MAYITDENGDFKRTVRCGHCGITGHNRSSCSSLRSYLNDMVANAETRLEGSSDDEWSIEYNKRALLQAKKSLEKFDNKARACGFCREKGHTRRTCTDRKQRGVDLARETIIFRKQVAERMANSGYAPGALVTVGLGSETPSLAVVTRILFGKLLLDEKVTQHDWSRDRRGVRCRLVSPRLEYGRMVTDVVVNIPPYFRNVDDLTRSQCYSPRTLDKTTSKVTSPMDTTAEALVPAEAVSEEAVTRYLIDEVIDSR